MPNFTTKILNVKLIVKLIVLLAIFYLYGGRSAYSEEFRAPPLQSQNLSSSSFPTNTPLPQSDFYLGPVAYTSQDYSAYTTFPNDSLSKTGQENSDKETVIYLSEEEFEKYKDSFLVWKDYKLYKNNQDEERSMTLLDDSLAMNTEESQTISIGGIVGYENSVVLEVKQTIIARINFDLDSDVILNESLPLLNILGKHLNTPALQNFFVLVQAHTCNLGSYEYNLGLSERRATSVQKYLSDILNVNEERILVRGASFSAPIASNDTEEGRAMNRRVEFMIIKNDPHLENPR
jgi:outer membrane protein OmpA-like peptidoglycan-associated protein